MSQVKNLNTNTTHSNKRSRTIRGYEDAVKYYDGDIAEYYRLSRKDLLDRFEEATIVPIAYRKSNASFIGMDKLMRSQNSHLLEVSNVYLKESSIPLAKRLAKELGKLPIEAVIEVVRQLHRWPNVPLTHFIAQEAMCALDKKVMGLQEISKEQFNQCQQAIASMPASLCEPSLKNQLLEHLVKKASSEQLLDMIIQSFPKENRHDLPLTPTGGIWLGTVMRSKNPHLQEVADHILHNHVLCNGVCDEIKKLDNFSLQLLAADVEKWEASSMKQLIGRVVEQVVGQRVNAAYIPRKEDKALDTPMTEKASRKRGRDEDSEKTPLLEASEQPVEKRALLKRRGAVHNRDGLPASCLSRVTLHAAMQQEGGRAI